MSERKSNADVASRRHLLKLGAMAAPAVITLAPASARAATSVLHCFVPFPEGVDETGRPCSGKGGWGDDDGWGSGGGHGGWPGHPGKPGGGKHSAASDAATRGGKGGGHGGGKWGDDKDICYPAPDGGGLTSEQIRNGFGIDGISADKDHYDAYVSYLNKVKKEHGTGVSCLMSIDVAHNTPPKW